MEITEEVGRRRAEIRLENPERAYSEMKDLLETRISCDEVHEEKYFNDIETGRVRTELVQIEGFEKYTFEELRIFMNLDKSDAVAEIQIKGKLKTEYPQDKDYQTTIWYYAYRALFDKFLYGQNRKGFEDAVEEKMDRIMELIRDNLEASYRG